MDGVSESLVGDGGQAGYPAGDGGQASYPVGGGGQAGYPVGGGGQAGPRWATVVKLVPARQSVYFLSRRSYASNRRNVLTCGAKHASY